MDPEQYLLLLLADANLPTGSFVASAGLESYVKHGFLPSGNIGIVEFVKSSLDTYARSSMPFLGDAHAVVAGSRKLEDVEECRRKIKQLDALYDTMTLNHVARRASKAQGVALLTLFSKGFTPPAWVSPSPEWTAAAKLIDDLKLDVRGEDTPGHLPVCWGVLTAALNLSLGS
ncbi:hypothetical protein M422DRAFT_23181 [Sphaerobolus stellatus SS14]|nr:hypothetical protein M422DRAFT_23181 [Sphaerobolus stellatus SS14]